MIMRKLPALGLTVAMALVFTGASAQQTQESKAQQGTESTQIPNAPPTTAEAKAIIAERFKAADVNHDGKLSREEAKAGMPEVYKRFDQIDARKRGYVTERQIGAYWEAKTKEQMQKENPIWN
ncbi:EF-hand domain-containing protein [Cupriavidus basilensis]|uniref:EF-hand domain-containing protein n=1 Tax=Cupriavidus basilensis TaxID=68895 RepID=UPI0023E8A425|nr:EF-hand domain-containing protein [Cupriavidus basilensis]MDF3886310.1 EF-hand domain-containing protein [Cupriavidus basilensis]